MNENIGLLRHLELPVRAMRIGDEHDVEGHVTCEEYLSRRDPQLIRVYLLSE